MNERDLRIRPANIADRPRLATLIHFERLVHRHLDWRSPLDWLGRDTFFLAEQGERLVAALACPPDPPDLAWIRLFAVADESLLDRSWILLWDYSYTQLKKFNMEMTIAAIPLVQWFRDELIKSDFSETEQVISLIWMRDKSILTEPSVTKPITVRPMSLRDLQSVVYIDHMAFNHIWRISDEGLQTGFKEACIATVAENETGLVGYQISTLTTNGGHLARLAVLPEWQGQGVGSALLDDLLRKFITREARCVSVNTQSSNIRSLDLYKKFGFQHTGEDFPVFQYQNNKG